MAESFDEQLAVADVYAAALFALAGEAQAVEQVRGELEGLAGLLEREPRLAEFLGCGVIDADERAASLERMFRGKVSDLLINTLQIMNAHERAHLLLPLRRAFELRAKRAAGQVEVRATSAVPLSAPQQAEVTRLAAELSGREPLVEYVVDPEILGGLVLQVGDYRYDNSVRQQLRAARSRLLERSDRGIGAAAE